MTGANKNGMGSQALVFDPDEEGDARARALDRYARADEPDGSLDAIAELVRRALGCEAVAISIANGVVCGAVAAAAHSALFGNGAETGKLTDPVVAHDRGLQFYAGVPVRAAAGERLGVLAALGSDARELDSDELGLLKAAAAAVAELVQLRENAAHGPLPAQRAIS